MQLTVILEELNGVCLVTHTEDKPLDKSDQDHLEKKLKDLDSWSKIESELKKYEVKVKGYKLLDKKQVATLSGYVKNLSTKLMTINTETKTYKLKQAELSNIDKLKVKYSMNRLVRKTFRDLAIGLISSTAIGYLIWFVITAFAK